MLKVCPQLPEKISWGLFLKISSVLEEILKTQVPALLNNLHRPTVMVVTVSASCLCLLEHLTVISSALLTLSPALSHHVIKSWREEL